MYPEWLIAHRTKLVELTWWHIHLIYWCIFLEIDILYGYKGLASLFDNAGRLIQLDLILVTLEESKTTV